MNLFDLLQASLELGSDRSAVVFGTRTITYGQLIDAALRVAALLRSSDVKPGDRILMYAPNCPEYFPIYLGCAHVGAIFAPVNIAFRAREMSYVLNNACPKVAFIHQGVLQQFRTASANSAGVPRQIIEFDSNADGAGFGDFLVDLPAGDACPPALGCAAEHGALLCYTSGTTSTPKPVLHSHGSEIHAAKGYVAAWRMERSDRGLVALPLAWIYGLSSAGLALLVSGATVVLMDRFNPERTLEKVQESRATAFFGSMSMYVKMLDVLRRRCFDLSSLRMCTNGAEPCPDSTVQAFQTVTGIRLTGSYALSEVRPVLSEDPLSSEPSTSTCGRLVAGAAIRLMDEAGNEVPEGQIGEAYIRSPGMLTAYYREPQMTDQRMSADGWLKTGDLLRRDATGRYFMVGRKGDMIIRSGVNIAPAEIESALLEHTEISQAVVLGIPDTVSGQAIVAFVVMASGASLDQEQLREHLGSRIAQYKLPQQFIVREDLPTNASGKLDRACLAAAAHQFITSKVSTGAG
jgi:long-chain acyl-CoA synthetase